MTDFVFNIAKGAIAEKARDGAANFLIILLTATETAATCKDYDTVAAMLAGTPNEATDGSYARKTGLTATITVDDVNDRVDVDLPDQTFTALAGAAIVAAVIAYQESASDAGRIPLVHLDFAITPDGSDVVMQFNPAGFHRAS